MISNVSYSFKQENAMSNKENAFCKPKKHMMPQNEVQDERNILIIISWVQQNASQKYFSLLGIISLRFIAKIQHVKILHLKATENTNENKNKKTAQFQLQKGRQKTVVKNQRSVTYVC